MRIDNLILNEKEDERLNTDINYFYVLYIEKQNIIEETNLIYEKLILKIYEYIFSIISCNEQKEALITNDVKTSLDECNLEQVIEEDMKQPKKEIENQPSDQNNNKTSFEEKDDTEKNSKDMEDNNTLKISETQNKVFLPYKIYELKKILEENPNEYVSIQDIINKNYIISLDRYKNATFARFKETYNLMRKREKSSFSEALDLALEMTFKNNLNPAIITSCNNLAELDMYLDCLEENKLDKFKVFNIEYEMMPIKM